MRRLFLILTVMMIAAGLASCRKPRFEVKVDLPEDEWGNYHISYYAADKGDGGVWVETTLPLEKGKATLTGATVRPALLYIRDNQGNEGVFYIEKGDRLQLTGKTTNPALWQADGNDLSEQLSRYRLEFADSAGTEQEKTVRFVKHNPDSKISALLLLTAFPRRDDPVEFVRLWNTLGEKSEREGMARLAGAADMMGDGPIRLERGGKARYDQGNVKIRSLALRREGGAVDTIVSASQKASLLYFFRRDDRNHKTVADTLKHLSKLYPDSSERVLAMISFDTDSVNWQSQVHADSVSRILTAWMPLGAVDRQAMRLGVASTPYIIVIAENERQLYRGDDISKAAAIFRKSMKQSSDSTSSKDKSTLSKK